MLYMMAMVLLLPILMALLKIELQTELNTSQYWIGILKSHQNMQSLWCRWRKSPFTSD